MSNEYDDFMDKQIFKFAYTYYKTKTAYNSYMIFHNSITNYIIMEQYKNIIKVMDFIGSEFVKYYGIPRPTVDVMVMNYFKRNNFKNINKNE